MNFVSIVKRVAPFLLTMTVGLFIASFFVTVAAPSFNFPKRDWNRRHREHHRQTDAEIRRLQEENARLKSRLAAAERQSWTVRPSFEPVAPEAPVVVPSMPAKTVPYKVK